jgi:hypothetical protein
MPKTLAKLVKHAFGRISLKHHFNLKSKSFKRKRLPSWLHPGVRVLSGTVYCSVRLIVAHCSQIVRIIEALIIGNYMPATSAIGSRWCSRKGRVGSAGTGICLLLSFAAEALHLAA